MALRDHLAGAFGAAAPEHYEWQTRGSFISEREAELVRRAFLPLGKRVLDVGCGEGATLHHLGAPEGAVGVDLFEEKLAFAREKLPSCRFVAASVESLPFEDGAFDHVIVRDVVHHLDDPRHMVDECRRVLGPGGRIDVLEPCRYNPLIFLHALTNKAERGELRSTLPFLVDLLSRRFAVEATARYQAMPIHRVVLHPDIGRPGLAEDPRVRAIIAGLEKFAEAVVPGPVWAYIHVRAGVR
jgi:ubiquinone/menaquinone biosynthesis C-methylase UbiE